MNIKIDDSDLLQLMDILAFYCKSSGTSLPSLKFALDMYFNLGKAREENLKNVDIF